MLEETHRRHPNDRDPLIALASFARDAGDLDAALRWATELLELSPGDPDFQRVALGAIQNAQERFGENVNVNVHPRTGRG